MGDYNFILTLNSIFCTNIFLEEQPVFTLSITLVQTSLRFLIPCLIVALLTAPSVTDRTCSNPRRDPQFRSAFYQKLKKTGETRARFYELQSCLVPIQRSSHPSRSAINRSFIKLSRQTGKQRPPAVPAEIIHPKYVHVFAIHSPLTEKSKRSKSLRKFQL